jgi:SPP1 gp7 family putative phage head morphogenesis protein
MISQVRATLPQIVTLGDVRGLGASLRDAWPDARIRAIVDKIGKKAEAHGSRPWRGLARISRASRGDAPKVRPRREYDGASLVDAWSRDATNLITSVRDDVAAGMRADVVAALEAGTPASTVSAKWIAEGIPVQFGTLEGRATVIARHQLSVLHARVQSERARAVGVAQFTWRTQGDDAVRDEHRSLEGSIHSYRSPPGIGLPGEPVNCRCWAESVISDELASELGISFVL